MAARTRAAVREYDVQVEMAWLAGTIPRMKKPPRLSDLKPKTKTSAKAMPWQDMLQSAAAWVAAS